MIPLLNADAQTAVRPKRLLLIFTPDGAPVGIDWRPTGTETAFNFHFIHAPLQPFAAKTVVPWGLSLTAKGAGEQHAFGMAGLWTATTLPGPGSGASFDGGNGNLTGWGAAPSIDQIIAQASGPNMPYQKPANDPNPETKYRSLALGVQCQGPNTLNRMTYTAANSPITPEINPKAAFDRIFAGVVPSTMMPPGGTPVGENPAVTRNRMEQKALVDCLKGDMTKIRTRVGAADFQKIDKHVEGLLAMERRLGTGAPTTSTPAAACTVGTSPVASGYPAQITSMMDIVSNALACDVTRVMTLQLSYAFSHVLHTWLGHTSDHHNMSHDGQDRRVQLQAIDNWYAKQVAYLLTKMDSVNEGNGTLLDNTLIVWGRELGNTSHSLARSPLLLIGKAAGALRTGRFLNYDGQQHVKLLVSVCQLMGLPTTSLGNIVPNSGPLVGLV
ncbi:MAG: DUF1552 domain-containing protein [Deltaproteobacteria bacterium]|nr:DUF1552 domain-containing protein [Deltaproteobacteria bacterium]